ncbi:MAG TPA: hypothetical protein VNF47_12750 [Streptosporangiaceae bacterium]|nr:hypothetical protein [Streptosporangiaceae bacterium]
MVRARLRFCSAIIGLAVPAAVMFTSPGPAQAAPRGGPALEAASPCGSPPFCKKLGSFKQPYKRSWTFVSKHLRSCVVYTAYGSFTYTLWRAINRRTGNVAIYWTNQTLNDPTLHAKVYVYSPKFRDCAGSRKVTKIQIGQHWTGYACSFNPSLSVSIPWGIGISAWPTCGTRNQASHTTTYGRRSAVTQFNSGSPAHIAQHVAAVPDRGHAPPPCYGVYAHSVVTQGGTSDSFSGNPQRVCLRKGEP